MLRAIHAIAFFSWFLRPVCCQSPCPEFFRYFRSEITGEMMATVEIPPPHIGVPFHLRVILNVPTILPTKYAGLLELAKSKEESILDVIEGRSLFYRLQFPTRNPIPVLESIFFNGRQYCIGQEVENIVVTSIVLEHTLTPPRIRHIKKIHFNVPNNDFSNAPSDLSLYGPLIDPSIFIPERTPSMPIPETTLMPVTTTLRTTTTSRSTTTLMPTTTALTATTLPTTTEMSTSTIATTTAMAATERYQLPSVGPTDLSCGLRNVREIIARGELISQGLWPWVVAIFVVKIDLEFLCAGNLITNLYVITVAHCLKVDGSNAPPNTLLVSLGRFNIRNWNEPGAINVEVEDFKLHPDYHDPASADADLAIIRLLDPVEFTANIRPICLWMGPVPLESIVKEYGYVVGWGLEKDGSLNQEPRVVKVPIVSQEDCLRSNAAFLEATSSRTFCAGERNGLGPCNGGSGSGLVMLHASSGRYHLRGIVSLSLRNKGQETCDTSQYVVYVDIAKHLNWLSREIK